MSRNFPLIRTFNNLLWNIRHFQHPQRRPAFRATRHPFCTNQQLREASCTYWLKETTKDFGQKLLERRKSNKAAIQHSTLRTSQNPNIAVTAIDATTSQTTNEAANTSCDFSPAELDIIQLHQDGDFVTMYDKLKAFKADGINISKDVIVGIMSSIYENPPTDTSTNFLLQSTVEQPLFHAKYSLRSRHRFSKYSLHVQNLYAIAQSLDQKDSSDEHVNEAFLKNQIWLCYHMEDLPTLQRLSYQYLQSPVYDTRTLSYIINAFTYSYDVEYAKTLFTNIVGMGRRLDETLFSSTLFAFIRVQALHDNVSGIYKVWQEATNCESPHPKTIAMLANQTYMYGTEKEIASLEAAIQSLGYDNNFLVQMTKMQTHIILKDKNKKKTISQDELKSVLEVRNTLGRTKYALKVYYESYIRFFCIHSDMTMVQFILKEMKKDGIPLTKYCYEMIAYHYVAEGKFIQLYQLMKKFVTKYTHFDSFFVRQIFHAFIKTYPQHAEAFSRTFDLWIQQSQILSTDDKILLQEECQVSRTNSTMTPFRISPAELKNRNKYSSSDWSNFKLSPGNSLDQHSSKRLTQFAEEEGIKSLMRRGIRPNYYFIEDLLRRSNSRERSKLLRSLPKIRMTRTTTRLKIYHFLMSNPGKNQFSKFYRRMCHEMNTSDKILFARRTLNAHDYSTTAEILESIGSTDMTDNRQMRLLNLKLRNNLARNNLAGCTDDLKSFALDKITLSPYIYTQCQYIEKEVKKKIQAKYNKQKMSSEEVESAKETQELTATDDLHAFLKHLQGFIGDIRIRLKNDQLDIQTLIGDTFQLLSQWSKSKKDFDERKA